MIAEAPEVPAAVDETITPTETPAAPEGTAPSAPVVETAITEPAAGLSTRPRGPDGRFIKADGTQASEAEHAAIEAADPASPPTPVTQPPAPTPQGQPFVVRGDGQKVPMPGSTLNDKGDLTVQAEHVSVYRQLIAEGLAHRGSWRQKEQDYERRVQEAGAVQEAQKNKYNAAAVKLLEHVESPEWLAAAVADPREIALLKREIGLMLQAADLKAPRVAEAPQIDPQVQQQQLERDAQATLQEVVEELLESPQAKAIYATAEDRAEATKWYLRHLATYAEEQDGQWVIDTLLVKQDFDEHMAVRQRALKQVEDARKAREFNEKRNPAPSVVPPVVSTRGPESTAVPAGGTYQSREEWRKKMGLG